MDFKITVVINVAQLPKLIHKVTHAGARCANHVRERLLTDSCLPSLPKFANNSRARARRFSLELNNWSTKSSSTRRVRAKRCAVNSSEKFGSSRSIRTIVDLSTRASMQSVKALAVEIL